ncbi:T9SS type A sorting domain-containing protein [Flavobacterium sp. ZT3R18]|uniref:T9SS type A sorting domain-containing protein n=1 Tax=Flavobacterium sp. ZT3R18 TaxID=2594429 RepID=UPI00117A0C5A|nr:T9SS type A sorting domain-containing protein [Flavobacterium sp. ZT3R18]TRX33237.1 T9SS type A sorting domain-containing protein [Flavobacterium sp. ZT3R18]
MKKIFLLVLFLFAIKSYGQDYTITLSYEASASDCHAAHFDWDFSGIDSFNAGGNSMNVSGIRTYTASGNSFTLSSNSSCAALGASSNDCNIPAEKNTQTETATNLIKGIFMNLGGCNGGVSIDKFIPNVSIKNNKASTICSGETLDLEGSAGFPDAAYHWQYSKDNQVTWVDVPSSIGSNLTTNDTPQTAFSINDLLGSSSEQFFGETIYFRLGYGQDRPFSNVIPITFSPCGPVITSISFVGPQCNGDIVKSLAITFQDKLNSTIGEKLASISVCDINNNSKIFMQISGPISYPDDTKTYTYTTTDLRRLETDHKYKVRYQAQITDHKDSSKTIMRGVLDSPSILDFQYKEVAPITFQTTQINILCQGNNTGSVTVINPQGGNGGYTYSKDGKNFQGSPTFSGLAAGTYSITVKDSKNCTVPKSISLTSPSKPISIKGETSPSSGPSAADGSIVLNKISGGTPSYKIFLGSTEAPNLSQLIAGSYAIRIADGNTCVKDTVLVVKQKISCIPTKTDVKCFGVKDGSISLAIQGGSGSYNVLWNNDATTKDISGLAGGTYKYTITDTTNDPSLTFTNSVTIATPPNLLSVAFYSKTQPTPSKPNGGAISISVTNGYGNYTYKWTKNTAPYTPSPNDKDIYTLGDGTYVLTVIDNSGLGCEKSSDPVVLKTLAVKDIAENNINCYGATTGNITVQADGGTLDQNETIKTYQYQWYESDNKQPETFTELPNETNPTLAGRKAGNYKVEIFDSYDSVLSRVYTLTQPNAALTATVITTNESCFSSNDGTAIITATGGTPINGNYTYSWKRNSAPLPTLTAAASNTLTAGNYEVIIKDQHQCITVTPTVFTITSPTEIIIPDPIIKKVSIFGKNLKDGAITIAPITRGLVGNEASTDYSYSWTKDNDATVISTDRSPTGLGKGTYHLTVKVANTGCTKTIDCVLPENNKLTVAIQETESIFCYGTPSGKLHAEIIGGITPYKIAWYKKNEQTSTLEFISNLQDIDKLTAGEYSLKVTDSANPEPTGPFAEAEQLNYKLINQKTLLTVASTSQTNVLCHGAQTGAISIQIEGGTAPYTAVWSNGNAPLPARTNLGKLDTVPDLFSGTYSVIITDAYGCTASLANPLIISQPKAPLLITDTEVKNLTGFETLNGRISVAITGGTSPYTYSFGNQSNVSIVGSALTLDKLSIGNYTLTITDANSCTTSNNYNIIQPDKLLITAISQTPTSTIKCNGDKFGILEATVTGGAPIGMLDANKNYTYKWYNILTPNVTASTTNPSETLVAGTYALTVTDIENNTFTLQSAPIIEPPLLKISYTQTNVSCYNGNNGTIAITVTGGTGNHTISWSNGKDTDAINSLRAGIYTVTVTDDNQCQAIENITITEPELLYVSKVTKNPPSALGLQDGSIKIEVTGGTPNYNYLWYNDKKDLIYSDLNQSSNTSINNIFAGQYFITVTDAKGCAVIEKDLDKIDPLVLSTNQINIIKCNGDATASIKAAASGGTPIYYYKWYKTTDPLHVVGQAATLVNATAGTYYVVLSDSFGLTKQSANSTITQPDILNNTLASEYTRCGDANDWSITTTPVGGTAPYTYLWNTAARTANLQDVPPANYSVLVTDNNGCSISKNITITAPTHLATAEKITKPTCFGGSDATIVLTSSGGQGPYTYLWNTGEKSNVLSNASAKVYSVGVTDFKGCVINKTYSIQNPPKDVINLGEDVTLCFDQSLTINATNADDKAKYSWTSTKGFTSNKPIITVSEPAEYTLVVTNRLGCNATDMLKISKQDTAISAEFASSTQVFMNEKFIIVDISNPIADNIEWVLPAAATVVSKDKDFAELSFSKAGEYELTLNTKKGNCTATQTKKIVVVEGEYTDPDSTDLKKKFDLRIYPNPSNGIFTVDVTLDKVMPAHIKVYNLTNNKIIDSKYEEGKDQYSFNFSLSGLTAGVYFVLVESQQGNQLRKIIIK